LFTFRVSLSTNRVVGSGVGVLFLGDLERERENDRERDRYPRLLGLLDLLLEREKDLERDRDEYDRLLEREYDLLLERLLERGLLEPAFAGALSIGIGTASSFLYKH